jgi:hypothetical protein
MVGFSGCTRTFLQSLADHPIWFGDCKLLECKLLECKLLECTLLECKLLECKLLECNTLATLNANAVVVLTPAPAHVLALTRTRACNPMLAHAPDVRRPLVLAALRLTMASEGASR